MLGRSYKPSLVFSMKNNAHLTQSYANWVKSHDSEMYALGIFGGPRTLEEPASGFRDHF